MERKGDRGMPLNESRFDVEGAVREEVKVLARSLAYRMAWRLGGRLGEQDPVAADEQAAKVARQMIALMGCYGFGKDAEDGGEDVA